MYGFIEIEQLLRWIVEGGRLLGYHHFGAFERGLQRLEILSL
jgi:hypothetical protein